MKQRSWNINHVMEMRHKQVIAYFNLSIVLFESFIKT